MFSIGTIPILVFLIFLDDTPWEIGISTMFLWGVPSNSVQQVVHRLEEVGITENPNNGYCFVDTERIFQAFVTKLC